MAHIGAPFTSLVGGGGSGEGQNEVVLVSTGNEPRPGGDIVLWVGGSTEPTNFGPNDVWYPA